MNIKKNDTVIVLSGKDKGVKGKVLVAMPSENKVIVEKVNVATCHTKPRRQGETGGIVKKETPIRTCKVALYCEKCGKFYDVSYIKHSQGVPRCTCGGRIKPDVVLYEEGLDEKTLYRAVEYIQEADVLIIAGTSLAVYPAAGLVRYYRGHKLVVINKTPLDRGLGADLVITGAVGETLAQL